jgi:hypothetical protein
VQLRHCAVRASTKDPDQQARVALEGKRKGPMRIRNARATRTPPASARTWHHLSAPGAMLAAARRARGGLGLQGQGRGNAAPAARFNYLVAACLALECALIPPRPVRHKPRQPHQRTAVWTRWSLYRRWRKRNIGQGHSNAPLSRHSPEVLDRTHHSIQLCDGRGLDAARARAQERLSRSYPIRKPLAVAAQACASISHSDCRTVGA